MPSLIVLNRAMVKAQGLTEEDIAELEPIYDELFAILDNPSSVEDPVRAVEAIELRLQRIWKFEQDRNMHSYWHRLAGCTCPSLSNLRMMEKGRDCRITSSKCPWHSSDTQGAV